MTSGEYLEEQCRLFFENMFAADYCESSREDDILNGTDFYIRRLPYDVTCKGIKDHCIPLGSIRIQDVYDIDCYIRYGNSHHNFKDCVLMLSFNSININRYLIRLIEIEDIDRMEDLYWAGMDYIQKLV